MQELCKWPSTVHPWVMLGMRHTLDLLAMQMTKHCARVGSAWHETHLGPVGYAVLFAQLEQGFDGGLQVCVHEVVIEDAWRAAVGQLVGMCLTKMVPGKWPMIQG